MVPLRRKGRNKDYTYNGFTHQNCWIRYAISQIDINRRVDSNLHSKEAKFHSLNLMQFYNKFFKFIFKPRHYRQKQRNRRKEKLEHTTRTLRNSPSMIMKDKINDVFNINYLIFFIYAFHHKIAERSVMAFKSRQIQFIYGRQHSSSIKQIKSVTSLPLKLTLLSKLRNST